MKPLPVNANPYGRYWEALREAIVNALAKTVEISIVFSTIANRSPMRLVSLSPLLVAHSTATNVVAALQKFLGRLLVAVRQDLLDLRIDLRINLRIAFRIEINGRFVARRGRLTVAARILLSDCSQ